MGRIDAIIPEELESKLRIEVVKRLGGKKGDLQKAIEEAIKLWINSPIIEALKATAMNTNLNSNERQVAADNLGEVGYPAIYALNEVANNTELYSSEREKASKIVNELLKEQKSR
jgi:hypothetical protein